MDKKVQQPKPHKRRRLRVKFLLKLSAFVCLIVVSIIYLKNYHIKNIYITGNEVIPDVKIIETLEIKDYPSMSKLKVKKAESTLLEQNPIIEKVSIKRDLLGKVRIDITETKILFYYKYNNKYITTSGKSIDDLNNEYYGYPILINFTPDTVFDSLLKGLNKVNYDIIKMINELEYNPYKAADGTIIDNNRFTLKMNDGNTVIIDTVNIKNLNKYNEIYASLGMDKEKGILYLDTITEDNIYYKSYDTIAKEAKEAEEKAAEENKDKEEKDKDKDKKEEQE